jgi:hypothetical protein
MKRILALSSSTIAIVLFFSLQTSLTSCQKETVIVHDTVCVCKKPDTLTLNLQPSASSTEMSYFGHNTHTHDESDGAPPELDAGAWTTGGLPINVRAMFKFDLSSIPANSKIVRAKLTLFGNPTPLNGDHVTANYGTDNSFYIRRVSGSWNNIDNAKWTAQPATTTTDQILIPHTSAPVGDLVDVDVAKLVQEMVNGSNNNYGFQIQLKNEVYYNIRGFCSSRSTYAAKRPKLVVEYEK